MDILSGIKTGIDTVVDKYKKSRLIDPSPSNKSVLMKVDDPFANTKINSRLVTPTPPKATPTPTKAPSKIVSNDNFRGIISKVWGDKVSDADRILAGENARREVGLHMDIPNRINPETGKWDNNAPIMKRRNPITGDMIDSVDRGLFRINNITFYDYMKRVPRLLEQNDIHGWDDMLDPEKNARFAKIIYDTQGIRAWYGAKL